eukprot:TRINITY_DN6622_c0_g1_i3.p1 TRINITY_DN6622_c0_g1~~TRINITY_DN6622_c0_g1_i3.p1  ORF type:complete len:379 (-),score=97.44 TRINITY_DN6622_c0_g1_i3:300-1436(-)
MEELEALGLPKKQIQKVLVFTNKLRRRKVKGSYECGKGCAKLIQSILGSWNWKTASAAIKLLHILGDIVVKAQPVEIVVGNMIRRCLYYIRDEYIIIKNAKLSGVKDELELSQGLAQPALQNIFELEDDEEDFLEQYNEKGFNLKKLVLDDVRTLLEELDDTYRDIAAQAYDHIHSKEVIMTFGKSNTVNAFLIQAAEKIKFSVIVAESSPSFSGQITALKLSEAGIDTTLIPDSAIFAMMSRVNKVIVGTHAVMADGSLITLTGMHSLAQAAKYYSVPFVVCAGIYKLSPLYPLDKDNFTDLNSPGQILPFEEVDALCSKHNQDIDVQNPSFDYIPPELISLFLTNSHGGKDPSYIYRLLSEYYDMGDVTFNIDKFT